MPPAKDYDNATLGTDNKDKNVIFPGQNKCMCYFEIEALKRCDELRKPPNGISSFILPETNLQQYKLWLNLV